jgi:quinol monooxygenase YgiN
MTEQEEREEFLAELRKNGTKLSKRAVSCLKVAWYTSDQLGNENVLLENQLKNALVEINRLKR